MSDSAVAGVPKTVVRPSRVSDAPRLSDFFLRAWREAGPGALGFTGATEEAVREIASEEFLRKRLSSPNVQMVVAEEGAAVVGFASLKRASAREVELTGVVVLESYAGRGLGSRLLKKALDSARKRGYVTVTVKTECENARAIAFYKGAGFTESGKTTEKVGRAKVALMVLAKKLR